MRLSAPIYRLKRQARLLSREAGIPLAQALDRIAAGEGFRSWSHLAAETARPAPRLFSTLSPGDLMLLAARPGHGKTLLGLELAVEAVRAGRHAAFFTLDYTDGDVLARLREIGIDPVSLADRFALDTSDGICADAIADRLGGMPSGTLAVVDYLQLLDQKRIHPPLAEQVAALRACAQATGAAIVLISQIDRRFDETARVLPGPEDVRLPNPLDLGHFTKTCFLHEGRLELTATA